MTNSITVVIPCYNAERWVVETIDSVKAQTLRAWCCIIVDDGSTDRSGEILDNATKGDNRFIVLHTGNHGVAAARNLAITKANGGYILPLDADDKLRPHALERFMEEWKRHPEASLLVPQIRRFGDKEDNIQTRQWYNYEDLKMYCRPTNSSCFKWEDWKRVGGYRSETMYEDWEFWLRLLYGNDKVINIPEVLVDYRIHEDSRWHDAVKYHDIEVAIIRKLNPKIYGK